MTLRNFAILILTASPAIAQTPVFEAASIKPATAIDEKMPGSSRAFNVDPTRLSYINVTLRDCIRQAWDLRDYQIEGPKSLTAGRFNVVATTASATSEAQMKRMLQQLLLERFKMTVRTETRDLPVFALVAGSKPKLKPSAPDTAFAKGLDGGTLYYRHISMEQFAEVLSGFTGRPVLDNTGLTGFYDVTLDMFEDPADMKKSMIRGDFGDVATSALQSQLGLRLEPRKGPIPMLIVDQAEKNPLEN